jgi:hypothetical protein
MSFPDLVIVKDQHVSGNEKSPGCFSAAEGGRGGEAASFDLFLTPAGRPRFFGEAFSTCFVLAGGALLERIIFALEVSIIISYCTHKKLLKNSTIIIKATSCRFYAFVINIFFIILARVDNLSSSLCSYNLRRLFLRYNGSRSQIYCLICT